MRALLDTHTLLWWLMRSPRLGLHAARTIENPDNEIFLSSVSAWEISIKVRLGSISLPPSLLATLPQLPQQLDFTHLPITWQHSLIAASYSMPHKDPFDRMLAAQAQTEDLILLSCDPAFGEFPVQILW